MEDLAHPDRHPTGWVLLSVQENCLWSLKEEQSSGKGQAFWARQETSCNFHASFFIATVGFSWLYLHVWSEGRILI